MASIAFQRDAGFFDGFSAAAGKVEQPRERPMRFEPVRRPCNGGAERALGANASGAIVRFCAVTYGNGARPNFYPTGNDLSAPLGKSIAALEPLKAKMSMPIGLDYTNILDDGFQYDGHFTYCATLTGTRQKKSDAELGGLVWALTPRIVEEETVWHKRPFMLGVFVLVLVLILNIIFW